MDLQMAETKNAVLGQDFLTWLWFRGETARSPFKAADGSEFELFVEQRVSVQGGAGEGLETAVVSGPTGEFKEARLGLRVGKKVNRALVRVESDGQGWQATIKAEDLSLNSLRTPKVETKLEEGDDPDAVFLEKIYLIERFADYIDGLYKEFLTLRLGSGWADEAARLKRWLRED